MYIILLGAMSEGRNTRVKASKIIDLRRSCLIASLSFGSQERNISGNGAIGITADVDMGMVVPDLTSADFLAIY